MSKKSKSKVSKKAKVLTLTELKKTKGGKAVCYAESAAKSGNFEFDNKILALYS